MNNNPFGKIINSNELTKLFHDNMTIMFGGFGGVGNPPLIIDVLIETEVNNLTLIGNDAGFPTIGIGKLVSQGRAKKLIASHIGSNPIAGQLMTEGTLEIEFSPQGTLAERIRAGGVGLGGVLVDIGLKSDIVRNNKQSTIIDKKEYLIETALTADVSIVFAKKADSYGNLVFDKSARNTNPLVAMAGDITIVEAVEIVELGELDPEEIVTPGVFVDYIVPSKGVNWTWVWEKTYVRK